MFMTKTTTSRSKSVTVLASAMLFVAMITLGVDHSVLGDSQADCPGAKGSPGCWDYVIVPCSNATCVNMSAWPEDTLPSCNGFTIPWSFDSSSVTSWTKCQQGKQGDPNCFETWYPCALVTLYWSDPCDEQHICGSTTINHCIEWRSNKCGS